MSVVPKTECVSIELCTKPTGSPLHELLAGIEQRWWRVVDGRLVEVRVCGSSVRIWRETIGCWHQFALA